MSFFDIILSICIITAAFIAAQRIYAKHIDAQWNYRFYKKALSARIAFSILFILVYTYYYDGGDTVYYFHGAGSIVALVQKNFGAALRMFLGERSEELRSFFDNRTGYPLYFKDANAWAVSRFIVPFYVLAFGSQLGTTLLLTIFMFFAIWDFYTMLLKLYPKEAKYMAIALFFLPSILFWSGGILKDVWCLVATLQIYKALWLIFFRKHRIGANILRYALCAYVLISIRPFVFYCAFATGSLWVVFWYIKRVPNQLIRMAAFPFILAISLLTLVVILSQFGEAVEGRYGSFDTMLQHAVVVQDDLSKEYYGDNSFNIGHFDATVPSILSKAPIAIVSGLFRPFLWEGQSLFLRISSIEAAFVFFFFIYLCIKTRIVGFIRAIINDSFLSSLTIFVIILAFFTGLTIANFGALVRYRIMYLPFFCIILIRTWHASKKKTEEENDIDENN
ncbi:MAG: hypothetical protein LBU90_08020 [Bacteroidales bacterium]|jgi:hypothetical protein|nr:hypothetical protein [Bacteroidales bacterium]